MRWSSHRFFRRFAGLTPQDLRNRIFEVSRWWRISPLDVEAMPLSSLEELLDQANRVLEFERHGK